MWNKLSILQKRLAMVAAIFASLSALGYGSHIGGFRVVLASELEPIRQAIAMNTHDRLMDELVRLRTVLATLPVGSPERLWIEERIRTIQSQINGG